MHSLTGSIFRVSLVLFGFILPLRGAGGLDYLSLDSGARKLYVSHGTKIVVVDMDKENVIGEIADTPGVHGLAVAPDLGVGFSSNGRENKVSIVDLKTLKTLEKVETGVPGMR